MAGRYTKFLLATSMFVMGACGIIYEYTLSVLGNHLVGTSHVEIFVVMGLMMFAMGVGSFLQQGLGGNLIEKFLLLEISLGLIGGYSALGVRSVFAISEFYQVMLYGCSFVIGALIGMEIPILIRINKQYAKSLKANLSQILGMDYAGALAGALLFAFVLLTSVSLSRIGFILGLTNLAIAAVGYLYFRQLLSGRGRIIIGFALVLSGVLLTVGLVKATEWDQWAEQYIFEDPIIHRETTVYQHIVLTKSKDLLRLYLNGHLQFSSKDEAIYHEMLTHPAMSMAKHRRHVLILGGGDGLAVRECLKYDDVKSITLVDIDPRIVELCRTHPDIVKLNGGALKSSKVQQLVAGGVKLTQQDWQPSMRGQRMTQQYTGVDHPLAELKVYTVDADQFLVNCQQRYDVVLLDFPDPSTLEVAKLYTVDFYRRLAAQLQPQALVAVQSTSPYHAKEVFLCIGESLRSAGFSVVPYHQNVPSFGEWGFHLATLQKNGTEALVGRLRSGLKILVDTQFLTTDVLTGSTYFGKGSLQTIIPIEANTKMKPVILNYHRTAWEDY